MSEHAKDENLISQIDELDFKAPCGLHPFYSEPEEGFQGKLANGRVSLVCPFPMEVISKFLQNKNIVVKVVEGYGGHHIFNMDSREIIPFRGLFSFLFCEAEILCYNSGSTRPIILSDNVSSSVAFFEALKLFYTEMNKDSQVAIVVSSSSSHDDTLLERVQKSSWDDLVLEPSLKNTLIRSCSSIFDKEAIAMMEDLNIPKKRGFLLYGPPGNGKTFFSQIVAGALGISLVRLITKSFDMGVIKRDASGSLSTAFEIAQRNSPCVVAIEEIDGFSSPKERSNILTLMDKLDPANGIIVVGTTNFPEKLDSALKDRPGRFDVCIELGFPAIEERLTYLRRRVGQVLKVDTLDSDVESAIKEVAINLEGKSVSHLQEAVVAAGALKVRESDKPFSECLREGANQVLSFFKIEEPKGSTKKTS